MVGALHKGTVRSGEHLRMVLRAVDNQVEEVRKDWTAQEAALLTAVSMRFHQEHQAGLGRDTSSSPPSRFIGCGSPLCGQGFGEAQRCGGQGKARISCSE